MDNLHVKIKLVIFTVDNGKLKIFLDSGKLPSGELIGERSLDESAAIIFNHNLKISLVGIFSEQLYTLSSLENQQEIFIVYYFLVPADKIYQNQKKWYEKSNIVTNKYDREIINYAVQRLRWKIEYTNAVYSLLQEEFTFSQLQSTYEAILGQSLDKRNFRKKILSLGILKDTGHIKKLGKARPAEMYAFKKRKLAFVKIL